MKGCRRRDRSAPSGRRSKTGQTAGVPEPFGFTRRRPRAVAPKAAWHVSDNVGRGHGLDISAGEYACMGSARLRVGGITASMAGLARLRGVGQVPYVRVTNPCTVPEVPRAPGDGLPIAARISPRRERTARRGWAYSMSLARMSSGLPRIGEFSKPPTKAWPLKVTLLAMMRAPALCNAEPPLNTMSTLGK